MRPRILASKTLLIIVSFVCGCSIPGEKERANWLRQKRLAETKTKAKANRNRARLDDTIAEKIKAAETKAKIETRKYQRR